MLARPGGVDTATSQGPVHHSRCPHGLSVRWGRQAGHRDGLMAAQACLLASCRTQEPAQAEKRPQGRAQGPSGQRAGPAPPTRAQARPAGQGALPRPPHQVSVRATTATMCAHDHRSLTAPCARCSHVLVQGSEAHRMLHDRGARCRESEVRQVAELQAEVFSLGFGVAPIDSLLLSAFKVRAAMRHHWAAGPAASVLVWHAPSGGARHLGCATGAALASRLPKRSEQR